MASSHSNDRLFFCCEVDPRESRWLANKCCCCMELQTASWLTAIIGFVGAIVFLMLQAVNGFSLAILITSVGVLIMSIVLMLGTTLERPLPVLAYVLCVGFPLWFAVGYYIYYIYVCLTSKIPVESYIPILVTIFLCLSVYGWYMTLCYFFHIYRIPKQHRSSFEQRV